MGPTRHSPSDPTQPSGFPCPSQAIHSSLRRASAVVLSRRHLCCHPFPVALLALAATRRPADRLLVLAVCGPEIGCGIPQPISTSAHTQEVRQIEYPRSVPDRSETPSPGNRLQTPAALKEIDRPVVSLLRT